MKKWISLLCSFMLCLQFHPSFISIYATEIEETEIENTTIEEPTEENIEDIQIKEEQIEEELIEEPAAFSSICQENSGNSANLVLFLTFQDTTHTHSNATYLDGCFLSNPKIEDYWTASFEANPWSMKAYLNSISYGQLDVAQIIPQYDASSNSLVPLSLPNSANYYLGSGGTNTNDGCLLEDAMQALYQSQLLPETMNLDCDQDGIIDAITLVVPEECNETQYIDVTSHASYASLNGINGKRVGSYTIVSEKKLYNSLSGSGLLIHEYLHTRGLSDLYASTAGLPVYLWDIMATESCYLQYPLAYYRQLLGWIDIDTITTSQTITLTSTSKANQIDRQAIILKTPYSDTEFFVVEYRQKGSAQNQGRDRYDAKIPGSGILIYRINTSLGYYDCKGGAPWSTYIFRENDIYRNGSEEAFGEFYQGSYFSLESGRPTFGSVEASDGLANGAITYSDNVNSGIVIKNIGSAQNDTITFDVEFSNPNEDKVWKNEIESTNLISSYAASSCLDFNGTQYILNQEQYGGKSTLYTVNASSLKKVADGPTGDSLSLQIYDNEMYVAYLSTKGKACIDKLVNGSFVQVASLKDSTNDITAQATSSGILMSCTTYDHTSWPMKAKSEIYCFNGKELINLNFTTSDAYQISLVEYESTPTVLFRKFSTNELKFSMYDSIHHTWKTNSLNLFGSGEIYNLNQTLYLIHNSNNGKYMYQYIDSDFKKICDAPFTTDGAETPYSLAASKNKIYVTYQVQDGNTLCKTLQDGKWIQIGNPISASYLSKVETTYGNGILHVLYSENSKLVYKYLKVEEEIPCTITYYSDSQINTESYPVHTTITILPNSFIKDGYRFMEWNTKKDGTGISYHPKDEIVLDDNLCLYAIWEEIPYVKMVGYSMSLSNKIEVNFFLDISKSILEDEDTKMIVISSNEKIERDLSTLQPVEQNGKTVYRMTYPLCAKDMTSKIQAKIKEHSFSFSVEEYVASLNERIEDERILQLANAMLNYGYWAQTYFDYKTELLPSTLKIPTSHSFDMYQKKVQPSNTVQFIGARYILGATLSIKLYFDTNSLLYDNQMHLYPISKEGKYTVITLCDVNYHQTYTIQSKDGFSLAYHPFSYAFDAINSNNSNLMHLCNALYEYVQALEK